MSDIPTITPLQMEVLQVFGELGSKTFDSSYYGSAYYDTRLATTGLKMYGDDWSPGQMHNNGSYIVLNRAVGILRKKGLISPLAESPKRRPRWKLTSMGRELVGLTPVTT